MRRNPLEKVIEDLEAERAVLDKILTKLRDQLAGTSARARKRKREKSDKPEPTDAV